jgi:hypothetical protein
MFGRLFHLRSFPIGLWVLTYGVLGWITCIYEFFAGYNGLVPFLEDLRLFITRDTYGTVVFCWPR